MVAVSRDQVLRYGGFSMYFLLWFVLFCYWLFPYTRLRDWIEQQVPVWTQGPTTARIGELSPYWLTGAELEDVEVRHGVGDSMRMLRFSELTVHVSPLSALLATTSVDFEGETSSGGLEGSFEGSDSGFALEAEIESVNLPDIGLGHVAGLPVMGQLSGTIDLEVPEEVKDATGKISLRAERLTIGDGEAQIKVPGMASGFTLEKVTAGTLNFEAKVADGVATLQQLSTKGRDLDLDVSGTVRLAKRMAASRVDVTIGAKFSDAYKTRDERTRALFDLMKFQPQVKRATGADGTLRYRLTGSLSVPRATPAGKQRPTARRPARAKRKGK